jgi:hypothetical protein
LAGASGRLSAKNRWFFADGPVPPWGIAPVTGHLIRILKEGFMKKSLSFIITALLFAALIALTGCEQATDNGNTVYAGRNTLYGSMTAADVQATIDEALAVNEPLVFEGGLTIGAGVVNLKNATIRIAGPVTTSNTAVIINAAYASLSWDPGATLNLNNANSIFIYRSQADAEQVTITGTNGTKVEFVERWEDIQSTATHVAVRNFTLGLTANHDYSTGSAIDPVDYSAALNKIYVLDKLTIPSDGAAPAAPYTAFVALGTVDVTGTNTVALAGTAITLAASATLTSSTGDVSIALPAASITTSALPAIKVEAGRDFTILSAVGTGFTGITVARLDGPGVLKVGSVLKTDVADTVTINAGNGTIEFTTALDSSAGIDIVLKDRVNAIFDDTIGVADFAFPVAADSSTGRVTFKKGVTFGAESGFRGPVEFNGAVARGNFALTFADVYLKNGVAVTLTDTAVVNLTAGSTIYRYDELFKTNDPIVTAQGDVVLTPVTGAILTALASPGTAPTTPEGIAALKKITLSGANLAITSGTLQVAGGGILEIDQKKLSTTGAAGALAVADGGTLALTGNVSSVIGFGIGDTTTSTVVNDIIVKGAGAATTLKASGGTVTLGGVVGGGKITGSVTEATLALGGTSADADINFALAAGNKTLTLDRVTLDLKDTGTLTISDATAVNVVALTNKAKLLLNQGTGAAGVDNENGYIVGGAHKGTIAGGARIAIGSTDASGATVYSIAHDAGSPVTITGKSSGTDHVVISKASTFVDTP